MHPPPPPSTTTTTTTTTSSEICAHDRYPVSHLNESDAINLTTWRRWQVSPMRVQVLRFIFTSLPASWNCCCERARTHTAITFTVDAMRAHVYGARPCSPPFHCILAHSSSSCWMLIFERNKVILHGHETSAWLTLVCARRNARIFAMAGQFVHIIITHAKLRIQF